MGLAHLESEITFAARGQSRERYLPGRGESEGAAAALEADQGDGARPRSASSGRRLDQQQHDASRDAGGTDAERNGGQWRQRSAGTLYDLVAVALALVGPIGELVS